MHFAIQYQPQVLSNSGKKGEFICICGTLKVCCIVIMFMYDRNTRKGSSSGSWYQGVTLIVM